MRVSTIPEPEYLSSMRGTPASRDYVSDRAYTHADR